MEGGAGTWARSYTTRVRSPPPVPPILRHSGVSCPDPQCVRSLSVAPHDTGFRSARADVSILARAISGLGSQTLATLPVFLGLARTTGVAAWSHLANIAATDRGEYHSGRDR